ncbi:hypothetical protein AO887_19090 [Pseudomonas aeruginosa]|nr:hypothetical protein AO887_19090 [Pseudomonas aeruginosa]
MLGPKEYSHAKRYLLFPTIDRLKKFVSSVIPPRFLASTIYRNEDRGCIDYLSQLLVIQVQEICTF